MGWEESVLGTGERKEKQVFLRQMLLAWGPKRRLFSLHHSPKAHVSQGKLIANHRLAVYVNG